MFATPSIVLNNGQHMPVLGLGTWQSKPHEVEQAVSYALQIGYEHLDCAQIYGNQHEVGAALARHRENGGNAPFVTSKIWNNDLRKDCVRPAAELILKELGLPKLDLLLIHWPVAFQPGPERVPRGPNGKVLLDAEWKMEETWAEMEKLVDAGLVASIGVSNFTAPKLERLLRSARIKPVTNQVELHPYWPQLDLLRWCSKHDIVLTAYSPLGSGRANLVHDSAVEHIARKHGKTPAQVLIRWAVERNTVVIPKSVHNERITENFNVFDFKLSPEDMEALNNLHRSARNERLLNVTEFFGVDPFVD